MNTQGKTGILSEEEDVLDLYRRIRASQGNLSDENVTSSRYQATSGSVSQSTDSSVTISSGSGSSDRTTPGSSSSSRTQESQDRVYPGSSEVPDNAGGPGASAAQGTYIEDSQLTGPEVKEVSVSERFHADYGVYEESFGNSQFFYATVGNGEITDGQVSIDFPANMEYVMEKDGIRMDYTSGQTLTEKGSYLLKISAVEDDSLPFSQQKIYKAVFRFRIQDRIAPSESRQEGMGDSGYSPENSGYGSENSGYGSGSLFDALSEENGEAMGQESEPPAADTQTSETEAASETGTESVSEEGTEPVSGEETQGGAERETETVSGEKTGSADEETALDEDSLEAILEEALGQGYGTEYLEGYNDNTGLVSGYDQESGYYRHQLASGEVFFTDVPNGMTTNYSVRILTNDNLPFRVFKDGEAIEYVPGEAIEEAGSYEVYPYSDTTIYLSSYAGKEEPLFSFRVLREAVNDLGIVNAPEHGRIVNVRYASTSRGAADGSQTQAGGAENEQGISAFEFCDDWCYVKEDGKYQIDIETETGISTLEFDKDTKSPYFRYQVDQNRALILYGGRDVAVCQIFQDGNLIYSGDPVREIEGPGNFQFTVYDKAGNRGSSDISIPYKMNTAAILVIVLLFLLLLVLGVAVRRIKKQVKVV